MNIANEWCRQASRRALLPLLGAACAWGCSGDVLEQSKQGTAAAGSHSAGAAGNHSAGAAGNHSAGAPSVPPSGAGTGGSTMPSGGAGTGGNPLLSSPGTTATAGTSGAPNTTANVGFSAKVMSVNGSGCAGGSATIASTTADSLTLNIPAYGAKLGGDATLAQKRQNCLLVLDIAVPVGFTYAVTSAALSGSATVPAGVSGSATTQYSFAGQSESASNTQPISGTSKWTSPGVFPPESLVRAPCDAQSFLMLNTALLLTGESDAESTIALDPNVTLKFALTKCQ